MTLRYNKPPSQRQLRVSELIRSELSSMFLSGTQLLSCGLESLIVSVTEVRISPDLKLATAFITTIPDSDRNRLSKHLESLSIMARRSVSPNLGLRCAPQINFVLDESVIYAARIEELMRHSS